MKTNTIAILFTLALVGSSLSKWSDHLPFCLFPHIFGSSLRALDRQVNLESYTGTWYEIARKPAPFQKQCGRSQAEYTLRTDGAVTVVNSCEKIDGSGTDRVEGKAVSKNGLNTELSVSFGFIPGAYWILDLAQDYSWSLVGEPCRKFLWVLAREEQLSDEVLNEILATAQRHGYDVSDIVYRRDF